MYPQHAQKMTYTEELRQRINQHIVDACETNRAEASLTALSYQSRSHPHRHVWIETDENGLSLDFEDWTIQDVEHQVVQTLDVESFDEAVTLIHDWLSGAAVEHEPIFTVHALRVGHHVILSEEEFATLIHQFLAFQPVEVIEKQMPKLDIEREFSLLS